MTMIMEHSIWSNLPPEIVARVLSRLPIKSLCRFRCVSPAWNSLISSPHFSKTLVNRPNTNNPPKAILMPGCGFHGLYSVDFSDENLTAKKLDLPSIEPSDNSCVRSLSSCDGLVLVSDAGNSNFLFNPFTGEHKELPKSPFFLDGSSLYESYYFLPGLGYDSCSRDHKVVLLPYYRIKSEFELDDGDWTAVTDAAVYSLRTDAWRRIQDTHYHVMGGLPGVHFNERLHWICWRLGLEDSSEDSKVLVAFDLADEVIREVQSPASSDDYEILHHRVAVLGGCLCLVVWPSAERIDVWMMTKYGVSESWTKRSIANPMMLIADVLCLSAEDELVMYKMRIVNDFNGVGMEEEFENGEELQQEFEKLVVYNTKKETMTDVVVRGIIPARYTIGDNYIETLVSPNLG